MKPKGPFAAAVALITISALLHLISPVFAGWTSDATALLPFGFIWLAIAWGLNKGWRWLGYLAFIMTLLGGSAALSGYLQPSVVPQWIYLGIMVTNWLAAAALLIALWSSRSDVDRPTATL